MNDWANFGEEAETHNPRGPRCGVKTLLESLAPEDRAEVEDALDRESLTHTGISAAFRRRGHNLSAFTIGRHRKRLCLCREFEEQTHGG